MPSPWSPLSFASEGDRSGPSSSPRDVPSYSRWSAVAPGDAPAAEPRRPPEPRPGWTRHLILLPTLNEEEGLEATLRELDRISFRSPQSPPTVAVIDGNSTDGTRSVAERWGVVCLAQRSKGKGAAIREGLAWAAAEGYDAVAVMDADGTYDCTALPAVFDLLDLGRELVVGVRRRETSSRVTVRDLVHRVGNGLLNYAAAQFTRRPLLDICSGFWGLRTSALEQLDLESDGFDIESELFVKAFRRNLRIAQLPVLYRKRVGTAKLHAVRDGVRILLSIVRHSLRRSPHPAPAVDAPVALHESRPLLNAILLGLGPEHVVLMSAADRLPEAEAVARRLTAALPHASLVRAILPSRSSAPARDALVPGLTEPANGVGPTVVVALPSRDRFSDDPAPLWLGIPRTRRIVCLRARTSGGRRAGPDERGNTPRARHERLPTAGPFSALYILSASLEPTWTRRELALLGANSAGFPMEVARLDPVVEPRSGRFHPFPLRRPFAARPLVGG